MTFLRGKDKLSTLTPLQKQIIDYIGRKGEASIEEMMEDFNLTEEALRREFAVLRHMEILKGGGQKRGKNSFHPVSGSPRGIRYGNPAGGYDRYDCKLRPMKHEIGTHCRSRDKRRDDTPGVKKEEVQDGVSLIRETIR